MNVTLLTHTNEPARVIAAAARLCYSDKSIEDLYDNLTDSEITSMIKKIIELGHGSVLEHVTFTFGIEGISRACSHQLVRARIASYSQQSQRYVRSNLDYIIPKSIFTLGFAEEYISAINTVNDLYYRMVCGGVPKEDARFVLPTAAETKIVASFNIRSLLNFFDHRLCCRSQWEIRELAIEMLRLVQKVLPDVFNGYGPRCVTSGRCPEGKMCCRQQELMMSEFSM